MPSLELALPGSDWESKSKPLQLQAGGSFLTTGLAGRFLNQEALKVQYARGSWDEDSPKQDLLGDTVCVWCLVIGQAFLVTLRRVQEKIPKKTANTLKCGLSSEVSAPSAD